MELWSAFVEEHPVHHSTTAHSTQDALQEIVALAEQGGACHGMSFSQTHTFSMISTKLMESQDGKCFYVDWPLPTDANVIHNITVEGADHVTVVGGAGFIECTLTPAWVLISVISQHATALRLYWRKKPLKDHDMRVNLTKTLYCAGNREFIEQNTWHTQQGWLKQHHITAP